MKEEDQICPVCKSKPELMDDDASSRNSNGFYYNVWCPNCGAFTSWYDRQKWPDRFYWNIPQIAKDKYIKE